MIQKKEEEQEKHTHTRTTNVHVLVTKQNPSQDRTPIPLVGGGAVNSIAFTAVAV